MYNTEKYWIKIEETYQQTIAEFEMVFIQKAYILHNVVDYSINQNTQKQYDDVVFDTIYYLLKRAESLDIGVLSIWYNFSDRNMFSDDGKCLGGEENASIRWYLEELENLYNEKTKMNDYAIIYIPNKLSEKVLQEFRKKLATDEKLLKDLLNRYKFYELII